MQPHILLPGEEEISPRLYYEDLLLQAVQDRDMDRVERIIAQAKRENIPLDLDPAIEQATKNFSTGMITFLLRNTENPPPVRYILASAALTQGRGQRYLLDYIFRTLHPTPRDVQFAANLSAEKSENNLVTHLLMDRGATHFGELLVSAVTGNNIILLRELLSLPISNADLKIAIGMAVSMCRHQVLPHLFEKISLSESEILIYYLTALSVYEHFQGADITPCENTVRYLQQFLSEESLNLGRDNNLHTPQQGPLWSPGSPRTSRPRSRSPRPRVEVVSSPTLQRLPPIPRLPPLNTQEVTPPPQSIRRRLFPE